MKLSFSKTILALLGLLTLVPAWAEDVIHFKNGAVLQGQIQEEDPALWVKIKTPDGAIRTYSINDVERILKSESPSLGPGVPSAQGPASGPVVTQTPGMAFLFSFLFPGLGCYVNGGDDTKIGLLCDGIYVGGIALMLTAGLSTEQVDSGLGYTYPVQTTTPFLWVGAGVALGGWVLGMIDAPAYAANHQARPNAYGDLLNFQGPGYELGLGLSSPTLNSPGLSSPQPRLAFRF